MPDGSEVEGPADLRRSLLLRPGGFAQALTTKLMMYALGREIDPQDMPPSSGDCARGGQGQLPVLVARGGDCIQ